jgi:hypothetical protein
MYWVHTQFRVSHHNMVKCPLEIAFISKVTNTKAIVITLLWKTQWWFVKFQTSFRCTNGPDLGIMFVISIKHFEQINLMMGAHTLEIIVKWLISAVRFFDWQSYRRLRNHTSACEYESIFRDNYIMVVLTWWMDLSLDVFIIWQPYGEIVRSSMWVYLEEVGQ